MSERKKGVFMKKGAIEKILKDLQRDQGAVVDWYDGYAIIYDLNDDCETVDYSGLYPHYTQSTKGARRCALVKLDGEWADEDDMYGDMARFGLWAGQ